MAATWATLLAPGITLCGLVVLFYLARANDNKHRFTADRRTVYAELVAALSEFRQIIAADQRIRAPLAQPGASAADQLRARDEMDELERRHDLAREKWNSANANVLLLAPDSVRGQVHAMNQLMAAPCPEPEFRSSLHQLLEVMRADLGLTNATALVPRRAGAMTWSVDSMSVDVPTGSVPDPDPPPVS